MSKTLTITIKPIKAGKDPEITVYEVEIANGNGVWKETLGSPELARVFMKGAQAAFSLTEVGYLSIPNVPEK